MPTHQVRLEVIVRVETTDEGERGIDRHVGLSPEVARAAGMRPHLTKDQLLFSLGAGCVYGYNDANQDGYADLDHDSIQCTIDTVQEP